MITKTILLVNLVLDLRESTLYEAQFKLTTSIEALLVMEGPLVDMKAISLIKKTHVGFHTTHNPTVGHMNYKL